MQSTPIDTEIKKTFLPRAFENSVPETHEERKCVFEFDSPRACLIRFHQMKKEILYFFCAFILLLPAAAVAREVILVFLFVLLFYGGWRIKIRDEKEGVRRSGVPAYVIFITSLVFRILLLGCTMGYYLIAVYFSRSLALFFVSSLAAYVIYHKLMRKTWPFFLPLLALFPLVTAVSYFTFVHRSLNEHLSILKNRRVQPVLVYYKGLKEKTLMVPGANTKRPDIEEILFMDVSADERVLYSVIGSRSKQKGHILKITLGKTPARGLSRAIPLPIDFIIHKGARDKAVMLDENGDITLYDAGTFKRLRRVNTRKKGQARRLFDLPYSNRFFVARDGGRLHSLSDKTLDIIRGNKIPGFTANLVTNPKRTKIYISSHINPNVLTELEANSLNFLRNAASVPWTSVPYFDFCKRRKSFYMMDRLFGNILVVPIFLFDIKESIPFGRRADILAYDEKRDRLYLASSSTGYFYVFNPRTKMLEETLFVGKGIRKILVTPKTSNVLVLSRYGIFRIKM